MIFESEIKIFYFYFFDIRLSAKARFFAPLRSAPNAKAKVAAFLFAEQKIPAENPQGFLLILCLFTYYASGVVAGVLTMLLTWR